MEPNSVLVAADLIATFAQPGSPEPSSVAGLTRTAPFNDLEVINT